MSCDHVIGSHGNRPIRGSMWLAHLASFGSAIRFFNTTRLAVPHPGFTSAHPFCSDCGAALESSGQAELQLSGAIAYGAGSEEAPAGAVAFTKQSYVSWLLGEKAS
jgi:hypothetical protein